MHWYLIGISYIKKTSYRIQEMCCPKIESVYIYYCKTFLHSSEQATFDATNAKYMVLTNADALSNSETGTATELAGVEK